MSTELIKSTTNQVFEATNDEQVDQESHTYTLALIIYLLTNYFDFVTSKMGFDEHNAVELNPILALAENEAEFIALKGFLVVAIIFVTKVVASLTGDKKLERDAYLGMSALTMLVVLSNLYQLITH